MYDRRCSPFVVQPSVTVRRTLFRNPELLRSYLIFIWYFYWYQKAKFWDFAAFQLSLFSATLFSSHLPLLDPLVTHRTPTVQHSLCNLALTIILHKSSTDKGFFPTISCEDQTSFRMLTDLPQPWSFFKF